MKKELVVFVKNKLITLDSVIPILVEMKQKFHVSSLIVVFDSLTHDQIQKNVVLKDAIDFVGGELYVSNGKINPIIRKINITISLIRLLLKFIKGVKILHFGALDVKPLKLFGILFKKNVYLFQ